MSDTIRKVQIEVDVVNGDLKITPPDVTSIKNALKQVKEEADATWRAVQGSHTSMGGSSAGNIGGGAKSTASVDSIKRAADEIREWYSSQQELAATPIKIGRLGYASSVRARSASIAQDELDFAKRAGITDGLDQHGIHRLRGHLEKRASLSIRETDRETANSTADSVRDERKRASALNQSHNAAIGAAKGLLQLAAAGDVNAASLARSVVAIEGLANVAKLAGVAMGPLGIGLTAVAAGVLAMKTAYQEAYATSQMYWQSIAKDAELTNQRITRLAVLQHQQATRLALGVPLTGETDRALKSFDISQEREEEIRKVEAGNFTPQHKAEFRARVEAQGNLESRQRTTAAEIEFKKKQLADLETAEVELNRKEKDVADSGRNAVTEAKKARDHVMDETTGGIFARTAAQVATGQIPDGPGLQGLPRKINRFGLMFVPGGKAAMDIGDNVNLGLDRQTGQWNSQLNAKDKADEQVISVEAEATANSGAVKSQIKESGEQKEKLRKEIADLELQQLTTTRAMQQKAYEAVRNEQERVTQAQQAYGSASAGERRTALRLQEKHLRIEAQRAANKAAGRPEDEGVEKFTEWELKQNPFGGIAGISMRRQKQEAAQKEGLIVESDLADRQKDFKEEMAKPLDQTRERVEAAGIDADEAAKDLADAIKAAFPFETLVEKLKAELRQLELQNQQKAMLRNNWF